MSAVTPAADGGDRPEPRRTIAIHPWLFALAPLLSLYATNHTEVPASALLRPALALLAFVAVLWLAFWLGLRRDVARGAAAASAVVFWWVTYGHIAPSVRQNLSDLCILISPDLWRVPLEPLVFAVWLFLVALTLLPLFVTRRRCPDLSALTAALNIAGAALLALPLASIVATAARAGSRPGSDLVLWRSWQQGDAATALSGPAPTAAAPDIYFIVLDAYGRWDALQHYYGVDEQPFLRELEKRGFYIVRNAHANYDQTGLCLTAALQMHYLDSAAGPATTLPPMTTAAGNGNGSDDDTVVSAIHPSPAAAFLRQHGYRIVTITTEDALAEMLSPDLNVSARTGSVIDLTPLETLLVNLTPLSLLPSTEGSEYDEHRDFLRTTWTDLEAVSRLQPERKFVFAHLFAPHPPFVFAADGAPVQPRRGVPMSLADATEFLRQQTHADYRRGYAAQVAYVNRRTLEVIDAIRANAKTPPVILLIGDHGSRQFLDWHSLARTDLRECFSNLSAYSLPDGSAPTVYGPNVTPVNALRLLLGHYFDADFGRLPDRSYYSTLDEPLRFTDVTARTAQAPPR